MCFNQSLYKLDNNNSHDINSTRIFSNQKHVRGIHPTLILTCNRIIDRTNVDKIKRQTLNTISRKETHQSSSPKNSHRETFVGSSDGATWVSIAPNFEMTTTSVLGITISPSLATNLWILNKFHLGTNDIYSYVISVSLGKIFNPFPNQKVIL